MSKLNKIFGILLSVMLFLITSMQLNADCHRCDPGFNNYSITINIGGCNYEVDLCAECSLAWPGELYINCITKLRSECVPSGFNEADIPQQVYVQLSTNYQFYYDVCGFQAPPCSTKQYSEVSLRHYACWYMFWEDTIETIKYKPCEEGNAECTVIYQYCINDQNELEINRTPSTLLDPCSVGCHETEGHEVFIPDEITQGPTDCYMQYNECMKFPCEQ